MPYNALHDRGYPSIGCAPCTRAVRDGEDVAPDAGVQAPGQRECGLHARPVPVPVVERSVAVVAEAGR